MIKIEKIRNLLPKYQVDAFIIPANDEFLNEYTPSYARRLEYVTNFTGSNGIAIITTKQAFFITDSRYIIQAQQQIDPRIFTIYDYKDISLNDLLSKHTKVVGFDPWLHTYINNKQFKAIDNLVDLVWLDKQEAVPSNIFEYPIRYSGIQVHDKINKITKNLKADFLLLTKPESVCWLLNIRAHDINYNPLLLAIAIVSKEGEVNVFCRNDFIINTTIANTNFHRWSKKNQFIQSINKYSIQIDRQQTPAWFVNQFDNIIYGNDPCQAAKAIKNKVEIKMIEKIHYYDGMAVAQLIRWIKTHDNYSELDVVKKVDYFRQQNANFIYPSFPTIAGFNNNGAIIHYHPTTESNKNIKANGILLVDSGGQYLGGTTDITRTIAIGKPSALQKKHFTLVLKGFIALSNITFPIGTTGSQLDILARQFLWHEYIDYGHGTGHGVGNFLSVHEGPQSINQRSQIKLQPGMILSIEPGCYIQNQYGIRIENLVIVEKTINNFLQFRQLTMVPIDKTLIDLQLLNLHEINWLNNYHKSVLEKITTICKDYPLLRWLETNCLAI